jgi:hypothetical protein
MKYIKSFEKSLMDDDVIKHVMDNYYDGDFEVGDYVMLHSDSIGKIVDSDIDITDRGIIKYFVIEVIIQNQLMPIKLRYDNIKRLATPEEIEDWKLKIVTNKYNI